MADVGEKNEGDTIIEIPYFNKFDIPTAGKF